MPSGLSLSLQARIGWTGEKQSDVYCITHDDTLHVWDSVEVNTFYASLKVHKGK